MSPGMRAARALRPALATAADEGHSLSQKILTADATIIERETGVAELIHALTKLCDDCDQASYHLSLHNERTRAEALDERIEQARAALTKATGGAS